QLSASLVLPPTITPSPDGLQAFDAFKKSLELAGQNLNLFEFLGIAMPGILSVEGAPAAGVSPRQTLFAVSDAPSLIVIAGLFSLIGLFLVAIYLESIARGVRVQTQFASVMKLFVHVTAFVLLLAMMGAFIAVPFLIGAALVAPFSAALGSFLVMLIFLVIVWALLYLSFAIPAIFVSGANALQAIANSIVIFRVNFRQAMGLVLLIYLIQTGFSVVWDQIGVSEWGIALDMIANAFLASGLVAAVMLFYHLFYHERALWLAQARVNAQSSLKG
ncbi:MAG: hypothetical protein HY257_07105, partial [Chloroflexi bacterium]|nr:hypothetical protein [Chloroflexota bacterium]